MTCTALQTKFVFRRKMFEILNTTQHKWQDVAWHWNILNGMLMKQVSGQQKRWHLLSKVLFKQRKEVTSGNSTNIS